MMPKPSLPPLPEAALPRAKRICLPQKTRAARRARHVIVVECFCFLALAIAASSAARPANLISSPPASKLDTGYGVGSWIWADKTYDRQACRFWRAFEIPRSAIVAAARLSITGDNTYRVFLDGRELGRGFEWRNITEHDLSRILPPGIHVLAVEAFNEYNEAGILAGLRIALKDGRSIEVASDESWRIVPDDERHWATKTRAPADWPNAKVLAAFGAGPWGWTMKQEAQGTGVPNPWFHVTREPTHQPIPFNFWQSAWLQLSLIASCGIVILICFRLLTQLSLHKKARHILQLERIRIARDIHDDLGAGLTQLVLFGEVSKTEFPPASAGCAKLTEICVRGRNLLQAIDEVVWLVNARRDTLRDFETYVCSYAEKFLLPTSIRCRFEINELPNAAFDLAIRRNLFLAVKEALNNAARHSGAAEIFVGFHLRGSELEVVVMDNGNGFDVSRADGSRNGLSNMAQRLAEIGGVCRISSRPGAGCRIELVAPLADPRGLKRWWPRRQRSTAKPTEIASARAPAAVALSPR